MSQFNYSGYDRRDLTPEEISKTINKKITFFGIRTDELSWAFYRSLPYFIVVMFLSFVSALAGKVFDMIYVDEAAKTILVMSVVVLILSTFLHVRVVTKLNKRFGDGTALLALSTTSFFTMLFSPKSARKNYDFSVVPNNNYQRIE